MMKSSMSKIETNDVMVGPVVSEGGRSPSTLSPGHGGVGQRGLAPGQRWSVGRKREVVLRLLRGESVELLSRELGVPLTGWSSGDRRPMPLWMAPSRSAKWIRPRANCPPRCSGSAN